MIEIRKLPKKGRGIVAKQFLSQGILIKSAPVSTFSAQQWELIRKTDVFKYCFVISSKYDDRQSVDGHIVFGLSSLCNHSDTPNAYVKWINNESGLWAHLIALTDIQPREEVSVHYTNIDEYFLASEFV